MAHFLRNTDAFSVNGRMAEAVLLTLIGDQAPALERLKVIGTNDAAVAAMVRTLQALNTGDYRSLEQAADRSPIESAAWLWARAY